MSVTLLSVSEVRTFSRSTSDPPPSLSSVLCTFVVFVGAVAYCEGCVDGNVACIDSCGYNMLCATCMHDSVEGICENDDSGVANVCGAVKSTSQRTSVAS